MPTLWDSQRPPRSSPGCCRCPCCSGLEGVRVVKQASCWTGPLCPQTSCPQTHRHQHHSPQLLPRPPPRQVGRWALGVGRPGRPSSCSCTLNLPRPVRPEAPPAPRTLLEALEQRMERYRVAAAQATAKGDPRKARMHERIVKVRGGRWAAPGPRSGALTPVCPTAIPRRHPSPQGRPSCGRG